MQNPDRTDQIHAFRAICQAHQLKVTPQRYAIYTELLNLDTHPTADEIFQIIQRHYPNISFDTVHRTLMTFAQIGIVQVVETFGGAKRFDPNRSPHHHVHCTQCGKILDFRSRIFDQLKIPAGVRQQFHVINTRVVLKGICKTCGP